MAIDLNEVIVLVELKEFLTLLTLIRLENGPSRIPGIKVDLLTTGALKKQENQKKSIKKDLIKLL